jgi:hypothetical protein
MALDHPARILYDDDGVAMAVADAAALPAGTRGFIGVGYDGTSTRFIRLDSNGYQVLVGAGTAGSPSGGVLSVQGVSGGQALPVSVTQLPVALVGGRLDTNVGAWLGSTSPTVGQKAMAASVPVALASDQSAIPVSQSGIWTVQQGTPPWAVKGTDADGAPPTQNPVLVAGQDGTNVQTLKTETDGTMRSAAADRVVSGTIAALNETVTLDCEGCGVCAFQVSGTWTGLIVGEASVNGTDWFSVRG